mgnify:CR=1 FL=1
MSYDPIWEALVERAEALQDMVNDAEEWGDNAGYISYSEELRQVYKQQEEYLKDQEEE